MIIIPMAGPESFRHMHCTSGQVSTDRLDANITVVSKVGGRSAPYHAELMHYTA